MPSDSSTQSKPSVIRLGEVAAVIPGVFSLSRPAPGEPADAIPMVTVRWLSTASEPLPLLHVGRISDQRADRYRLREGDVLVPSRSTSIRVAVAPRHLDGQVFNSTLLAVRCTNRLLPGLLATYLSHAHGAAHLVTASQSGTAQMNLTATALGEIPVPLVPADRQRELVELLGTADNAYHAALESAELRRRIAQNLVIARMTGRTPNHA